MQIKIYSSLKSFVVSDFNRSDFKSIFGKLCDIIFVRVFVNLNILDDWFMFFMVLIEFGDGS